MATQLGIDEKEIKRKATDMTVHGVIHDRLYLLIQLAEVIPDLTPHIPALRRAYGDKVLVLEVKGTKSAWMFMQQSDPTATTSVADAPKFPNLGPPSVRKIDSAN